MSGKMIAVWFCKAVIAGIAALAALCVFSFFYDNKAPAVTTLNAINQYPGYPNTFYSYMVEGFGFGKTDKNGYMNLPEAADSSRYDVVIMGSSHMEALQIPQKLTAASLMNEKLENLNVYNIAGSGLYFLTHTQEMRGVLENMRPKYLLIETLSIRYDDTQLQQALSGEYPASAPGLGTGIGYYLQKIPYLRLMYHQFQNIAHHHDIQGNEVIDTRSLSSPSPNNTALLTELLTSMRQTADEYGAELIIFYDTVDLQINEDGSVVAPPENMDSLSAFASACDEAGVTFVDMTGTYLNAYQSSFILPNGFMNSQIGKGHLNTHGHRMVAEELSRLIMEMEEES